MQRGLQGHYLTNTASGEPFRSFLPAPLPPDPPIMWTAELREKCDAALLALGRLDSLSLLLPDTSLFIYMYVRKEALLSSMIEGTQSSLSDLLLVELQQPVTVPLDDVKEVCNYVAALDYGIKRLAEGFPLSLHLLKEIHHVLLSTGRGAEKSPGEFRSSQNWIGGTRPGNATFVPPPADCVLDCMGKLELFLHNQPVKTSLLEKIALAHLQFETIHPFLDGNGRLGRLMISLLLHSAKVLKEPLLYISYYFKAHRQRYYELLNETRMTGDWETWLDFFVDAVIHTANQATDTANRLLNLSENDRRRINELKRISGSVHLVHQHLLKQPLATPNRLREQTQLTQPTVNACLEELEKLGIVKEITGKKRNRVYSYTAYIDIMNEGTELPE
jgi:Fic family protein